MTVSNVDNLGARVDPVVVGMHLLGERPLTCEVARKEGDMGGAPVRVDGRLQLVEGPRFPVFEQDLAPVFNTNTALFDLERSMRTTTSPGCTCARTSTGETAVQLERALPRGLRVRPDAVPRGAAPRPARTLLPIKTPADLERAQDDLRELVAASPL